MHCLPYRKDMVFGEQLQFVPYFVGIKIRFFLFLQWWSQLLWYREMILQKPKDIAKRTILLTR